MGLLLGDVVPDFEQESTHGRIRFHDWIGESWAVLFSHPKDFTPVCTTELGAVARLRAEFEKRHTKVIAVSVDTVEDHLGWIRDIEETQGVELTYPILADADRTVSDAYQMIHPKASDSLTVRCVFVIDHHKRLRASITYPASTGRAFGEILRVIDSLQLTDRYKVATPVDWQNGADVIVVPALSDEAARPLFPKGWTAVKPYLRVTPQPNR
ncbi:peroxiredoxin [Futiania mangrovi]|uniref:Thioredoxin peroxidase n=1 Tax=Futiania mangrovi TaxID=2959716 RepID=A0A9J6PAS2_9PROT|nr:peroxiredoxin [Futiania mangrovii]MCP1336213.1 peroxiredoxin [Futiania mangrovii]